MPPVPLLTPFPGTVTSTSKLNLRAGAPRLSAPIVRKLEPGVRLHVRGILRGDEVQGNADWYAGDDDLYFWSGGTGAWEPSVAAASSLPASAVQRRANGTIKPLPESKVRPVFGDVGHTELGGGRVALDPAWESQNLVDLPSPLLATHGFPAIRVHRKAAPSFAAVLSAIAAAGLASRILTCAGTFVPRHKNWDVQRSLSPHSWGIALDINVAWNGYGATPAALGAVGSVRELVPLFEAEGFAWGGFFASPGEDGMHFELARLDL